MRISVWRAAIASGAIALVGALGAAACRSEVPSETPGDASIDALAASDAGSDAIEAPGTASACGDGIFTGGDSGAKGPCVDGGWCWENPLPHEVDVTGAWGTAPNDVWFVTGTGWALHWNGTS